MATNYRGSVRLTPVKESIRKTRDGPKLIISPPEGYGGGEIHMGDSVYIIPGCGNEAEGGAGVVVEPEGPAWLSERGWVGVRMRDGEVSNFQKKCLWLKK